LNTWHDKESDRNEYDEKSCGNKDHSAWAMCNMGGETIHTVSLNVGKYKGKKDQKKKTSQDVESKETKSPNKNSTRKGEELL
jgi:hypothetical protein